MGKKDPKNGVKGGSNKIKKVWLFFNGFTVWQNKMYEGPIKLKKNVRL